MNKGKEYCRVQNHRHDGTRIRMISEMRISVTKIGLMKNDWNSSRTGLRDGIIL